MKGVELLAPGGDLNKLKVAFMYGADAVYVGGSKFGLRASATVDEENLKQAIEYAHALGKKVYVTVNIFARNNDFTEITNYMKFLESINVDAIIVSDLGVLKIARENTGLEIHISTQANILNKYTAEEYVRLGARRIILGRECTLGEIAEIAQHLKKTFGVKQGNKQGLPEIEVFVHGAMCVSYSGRCLLSNLMVNRDANRGECAHPCRWKYSLVEEKRPGEYFPISEDLNGTYIMNSRDLCLINHLDKLKDAGVTSFKIEGRMKSEYYVASVVKAYRQAMDGKLKTDKTRMDEINKSYHRPWTTGFLLSENNHLYLERNEPSSSHEVVATCLGGNSVELKNAFNVGDELEILSFGKNHNKTFKVTEITQVAEKFSRANKAGEIYEISCPYKLQSGEFLRKRIHH